MFRTNFNPLKNKLRGFFTNFDVSSCIKFLFYSTRILCVILILIFIVNLNQRNAINKLNKQIIRDNFKYSKDMLYTCELFMLKHENISIQLSGLIKSFPKLLTTFESQILILNRNYNTLFKSIEKYKKDFDYEFTFFNTNSIFNQFNLLSNMELN